MSTLGIGQCCSSTSLFGSRSVAGAQAGSANDKQNTLSKDEQRELQALQKSDREVKAHEAAHRAAAGGSATSGPSYQYKQGPDGQLYAVAGEVHISLPSSGDDPETVQHKARSVQRAALAPAEPSAQDRKVAAEAAALAAVAASQATQPERTGHHFYTDTLERAPQSGINVDTFA